MSQDPRRRVQGAALRAARVLACAALALLVTASPPRAEVVDRVLAVVDGQLVTLSDLRTARALGLVSAEDEHAAVGQLVDRWLMLAEASRYGPPEPTAEAVEARVAALRKELGEARFSAVLRSGGLDEAALRRYIRQDLVCESYLAQRFAVTAQPTDAEVDAYVAEHRAALTGARGEALPADEMSKLARERLVGERRSRLQADWLAGLRRRADISVRPVTP